MNVLNILLVAGVALTLVTIFLLYRKLTKPKGDDQQFLLLNQRMDAMSNSLQQALRDTLQLVSGQLKESRESVERSSQTVHKQVESFTTGLTQLSENLKQVHESVKGVSSFQDIFKAPKLRGIWGEASLEASLNQYFSKDSYRLQHYFKSGEAVDAILQLPNDLILPIDSKFNWENFEKMINSDPPSPEGFGRASNDKPREYYKKLFFSDVKKKIDEISAKYILPSEGTTDFALMYIPAETVYYEVINNTKDADIPAYARGKHVFLVSPNTFGLSVSAIRHWIKDIQTTKQTREIIKRLERIATDGKKLGDDFRRLGKHLSDARGSYDDSEKRLSLMVDRVENVVEIGEGEEQVTGDKKLLEE